MPTSASWRLWPRRWISRCSSAPSTIAAEAERSRENVEAAVARRERYLAANEALRSMCQHEGRPLSEARIFTAHTADDRIENFYMRSIVGTGPGGFPQHALPQRIRGASPARHHPRRAARLPLRSQAAGDRGPR